MEKAKVKASDISVAAVNGPKMTVISGRKEVVDKAGKPHESRFAFPRVQSMGGWYHSMPRCLIIRRAGKRLKKIICWSV